MPLLKNNANQYSALALILHWVTALTVFGLFGLGWWMVDLNYYHDWYQTAPDLHQSIGVTLAFVVIGRLIYRLISPYPKSIPQHKPWEKRLAHVVHWVLYGLLLAMFVTGYLITSSEGDALSVFGLFEIPGVVIELESIENIDDLAGRIHEIFAYTVICLALLHMLGALKHHFVDKDATLKRIFGVKS